MRAILTKYLGPTTARDARIRVTDPGYAGPDTRARTVTVPWNDRLDDRENHAHAARVALERWGWRGLWVGGSLDAGYTFVCVTWRAGLTVYPGAVLPHMLANL